MQSACSDHHRVTVKCLLVSTRSYFGHVALHGVGRMHDGEGDTVVSS
jgi:hypothetical protein